MIKRYCFEVCGVDNAELMWKVASTQDVSIKSLNNIRRVKDVSDAYYSYEGLMTEETYLVFCLSVPITPL